MKKSRTWMIVLFSATVGFSSLNVVGESAVKPENLSRYNRQLKHYFPNYGSLERTAPAAYRIKAENGDMLGTLYLETVSDDGRKMGYAGTIEIAVAVDADGRTAGVLIGKNQETPSFLRRVAKAGLLKKWNGKTLKEIPDLKVDAVTRATYSSNAIIDGVRNLAKANTGAAAAKPAVRPLPAESAETDASTEIQKLKQREAILKRIVSGSQRLLTQLQTRKEDELKLRLIAAIKGKEAANQFAKENNLMFFNHPGRGKSKVDLAGERYRKDSSESNLKALKAAILEEYERMLESVPPHNAEQEKALAAVQTRRNVLQGKNTAANVSRGRMKFRSKEAQEQEAKIAALAADYRRNPDEKTFALLRREVTNQFIRGVASMSARLAVEKQKTEHLENHLRKFLEDPDEVIQKRISVLTGK